MRVLFRLLTFAILFAFALVGLSGVAERLVLYPFDSARVAPGEIGLESVEETELPFEGGALIVWTASPRPGKPVIFYLHGNAGNLADRAGRFHRFLARGYGLVAMAYPGSSGSTGKPSENLLAEATRLVWQSKSTLLSASTSQTVIYGESLGTALAIALNAALPAEAPRPVAIILEAPFTSIPALAAHHYPGTQDLAKALKNQWNSLSGATQLVQPLMILQGQQDDLIPVEMGRQILSAAASSKKSITVVPNAGHTDLWRSDTLPGMWRFIDHFALR